MVETEGETKGGVRLGGGGGEEGEGGGELKDQA